MPACAPVDGLMLTDHACFLSFSKVPTLDGRVLRLPCPEVVSPGYERRLGGEGMPISKSPGSRGDLLIRFKLVFPAFLPQASKVPTIVDFSFFVQEGYHRTCI